MTNSLCLSIALLVALVLSPAGLPAARAGDHWGPVDPADLAMKVAVVEKEADAEVIFWEVQIEVDADRAVLENYIRIKIFTERGRDSQSAIDLPYYSKNKIEDIAGRTIKTDGSVVELKPDGVFERILVKAGRMKIKAKSFVMPAVDPGAIIEYRWREVLRDDSAAYLRLVFQREIPVRVVKYYLKPPSNPYLRLRAHSFNYGSNVPFAKVKDDLYTTARTNVPAFHREAHMPPDDEVRSWILVYFSADVVGADLRTRLNEVFKSAAKVNDEIRRAAAAIVGNASSPEQRLERLFDYCRSEIENTQDDASGLTDDDRSRLKQNKTVAHTLKRRIGTGWDINLLFAALAIAAGFEARLAQLPDRSDKFFNPQNADLSLALYFLRASNIAVRVEDQWRFFDPASKYVPYKMLRWQEEGLTAQISDPVAPVFAQTPLSAPEKSTQKRTAKLHLSEDGMLEGDVRIEYTGHIAVEHKEYNDDESPAQREKILRDQFTKRMNAAELSDIRIENMSDPVKPFIYSFHVRVPGYAQRTGKRLFFQPAFFQYGLGALFSSSERKHPVYFHYAWSEEDRLSIELPAGFELDNADSPGSFAAADVAKYAVRIGVGNDRRTLEYERIFSFHGILFPAGSYSQVKQFFDAIHEGDGHMIALKQSVPTRKQSFASPKEPNLEQ